MNPTVPIRRAGPDDVDALVRLRRVMLAAMGDDVGPEGAAWEAVARSWFAERLPRTGSFAAFVADDPGRGVLAAAVGRCEDVPPGPANPGGVGGHLFNVATEPAARRRGLARACVTALLDWFDRETPAAGVRLNATPDGRDLYTGLGFVPRPWPELRRPSPPI